METRKLLSGDRIDEILQTTFAAHEEGINKSPIRYIDILQLLEEQAKLSLGDAAE